MYQQFDEDKQVIENQIRSAIIAMLDQNASIRVMVKAAKLYDKLVLGLPKMLYLLMSTDEGVQVLKEMGFHDKITTLIHQPDTE